MLLLRFPNMNLWYGLKWVRRSTSPGVTRGNHNDVTGEGHTGEAYNGVLQREGHNEKMVANMELLVEH
jgi:hypothetical protein